ncbi:ribosomal protein S18-alanine N-acetyltransferase [Sedimentibacter sp. zth1]|uniref:ribosomal protein S18-alanine N-acetyltransferase n=1 Tax=Sedimentibacter sp. zth1 TaxID=2816908 RepID=UPI001F5F7E77|nr:ribosomal protein S18-alanine N-acetyltransferase [Sedimentibacter sp. zth1]
MKIIIRPMEQGDIDDIVKVENNSFSTPWSREAFTKELSNPMALYLCVVYEEHVIGYAGLWKIYDEGHITNVAILSTFRGHGISKLLMKDMIEMSIENNINRLTLEVRESNLVALNLYTKLGFENCGKRPKYYSNPTEDAIIMWKELGNEAS